jgi:hypothetical protein
MDIICIRKDCSNRAIYAYDTSPIYCSEHREDGMKLNGYGKCIDCSVYAIFNYISESKPLYCRAHKKDEMIDVTHTKCEYGTCLTRPVFNYETESFALFCSDHKKKGMVDVINNICIEHDCRRISMFGFNKSSPPMYCRIHRKPNTINVRKDACNVDLCVKHSLYNRIGETEPLYCKEHMSDGMVDVRNKRCIEDGCITASAINGHCKGCYNRLFSDAKMYQVHKYKENTVIEFLKENYAGVEIEYNEIINSYQSPIIIHFPDRIFVIEIDFINTEKERERLLDVMGDLDSEEKAVYAIRLNPNWYRINGALQKSSWSYTNKFPYPLIVYPKWDKRLSTLKEHIDYPENEIEFLYFDR